LHRGFARNLLVYVAAILVRKRWVDWKRCWREWSKFVEIMTATLVWKRWLAWNRYWRRWLACKWWLDWKWCWREWSKFIEITTVTLVWRLSIGSLDNDRHYYGHYSSQEITYRDGFGDDYGQEQDKREDTSE
jgi:hypothetical protein